MDKQEQFAARQWRADYLIEGGGVIAHDFDYHIDIMEVESVVREMIVTKQALFWKEWSPKDNAWIACRSLLGARLLACLKMEFFGIERAFPRHKFCPFFTLLKDLVQGSSFASCSLTLDTVDHLNSLVTQVRQKGREQEIDKGIARRLSAMRKNARSVRRYLRGLFEKHAKIVAVRLDFGASVAHRKSLGDDDLDPAWIRDHFGALVRQVKQRFPSLVGFVARLEYAPVKSFHIHAMFLFDGQHVREDVTLGQRIGEIWESEITEHKGTYFNCNARKEAYRRLGVLGIGTISYNDTQQRDNLERAAMYLVKADYYAKLRAPGIHRTFFRGILKRQSGPRRGRPRAHKNGYASEFRELMDKWRENGSQT